MAAVLKPGDDITPNVTLDEVEGLLGRLYGVAGCAVKELPGYDDKNYHVIVVDVQGISNPHLTRSLSPNLQSADFILKITNSLDSQNSAQFDAHKELMLHLAGARFRVPEPLRNLNGEYFSLELLGSKQHMVRLLSYLPGTLLKETSLTNDLGFKLGSEVARMTSALSRFSHEFYASYRSVWMLGELNRVRSFMYVLKEPEKGKLVGKILDEFQHNVLDHIDTFEKGVIHGDINEGNILVTVDDAQTPTEQFSILDFGDSQHSCLVFDLAIAITYMILLTESLDIGAYILAGYAKVRRIPYKELKVLKTCIKARLCQSLVLGLYTFEEQGGTNTYVLGTQEKGWRFLGILDKYDTQDLIHKWTQVGKDLESYDAV